jgi:hypothetical protein
MAQKARVKKVRRTGRPRKLDLETEAAEIREELRKIIQRLKRLDDGRKQQKKKREGIAELRKKIKDKLN